MTPLSVSDMRDEWHCWTASVGYQRQMRPKPSNRRQDAPVVQGVVGEWVICYRFECITRTDVTVSGVRVQRLRSTWTPMSSLCVFNAPWKDTETMFFNSRRKLNNSTSCLSNVKIAILKQVAALCVPAVEHAQHDTQRLRLITQLGFTFTNLHKVLIKALLMGT